MSSMRGFRRNIRSRLPAVAKYSPPLHPKAASGGWWLGDDIDPSNCILCYQPKGADSYADSKSNLANPGTYDATEGVAPAWATGDGWKFNGSTHYLKSGYAPDDGDHTYMLQYTNCVAGTANDNAFGERDSVSAYWVSIGIKNAVALNRIRYRNVNQADKYMAAGVPDAGNVAIAGSKGYLDGVDQSVTTMVFNGSNHRAIWVGAANTTTPAYPQNYYCVAFVIYDIVLTQDQIDTIYASMSAL